MRRSAPADSLVMVQVKMQVTLIEDLVIVYVVAELRAEVVVVLLVSDVVVVEGPTTLTVVFIVRFSPVTPIISVYVPGVMFTLKYELVTDHQTRVPNCP